RSFASFVVSITLLAGVGPVHAKLTTDVCLAQKRVAWGTLRKCQATEGAKQLKGKLADLPKCDAKFHEALAKIDDKAAKAVIACRFGDNGDGTVIDYDTGLHWEKKTGSSVLGAFLCSREEQAHCVTDTFTFSEALLYVNASEDGVGRTDVFDGF